MSLTEDEALQAVKKRLAELKPGDKAIIGKVEDGFLVYSEFHEIRIETLKMRHK